MLRRPLCPAVLSLALLVACNPPTGSTAEPGGAAGDPGFFDADVNAAAIVAHEAGALDQLTYIKAVMNGFIEDDPTLDLTKDAAGNADNIAARVQAETASCAGVSVSHADASATVAVDFGAGCTLATSGAQVSGRASATATVGGGKIEVSFAFTDLGVAGYAVDGTALLGTTDLEAYSFDAELSSAAGGHMTFHGSAAVGMTGSALGVTLDGTGTYSGNTGASAPLSGAGFTCTDHGTTFTLARFHRAFLACYADAGELSVTKTYTCSMELEGQTISLDAGTTCQLAWSAETAASGEIEVTVSTELLGETAATQSFTVALPARSGCGGV